MQITTLAECCSERLIVPPSIDRGETSPGMQGGFFFSASSTAASYYCWYYVVSERVSGAGLAESFIHFFLTDDLSKSEMIDRSSLHR